jgi:Ca2+/Na+ antiporter
MRQLTYLMHGFVFAFGSAIILYGTIEGVNIFVSPRDVFPPTLFSVLAFFLFVVVAYLLTRKLEAAGLIASLLVLGFFYLWSIFWAILLLTLVGLLVLRMLYKRVMPTDAHLVLNTISIAIVGYYVFQFVTLIHDEPWRSDPQAIEHIDGVPDTLPAKATTPDIYYIILDGYGRADMLQTLHNFDNSRFVKALEQRGFVVAEDSQSNYHRTLLSLSSSLNIQYLDKMSAAMGDSHLWWPVSGAVQHSEVRRILEDRGYKTVFFANNGDYSDIRDGDFYEAPFPIQLNIFNSRFFNLTNLSLLAGIDQLGIADLSYDTHRRIILHNFERLPEVAVIKGPKFVFTHIIAPHPPYVFDRDGNPLDPPYPFTLSDQMTSDIAGSRRGYIEQLQFINREVLETIDGILANSEFPPIIIIQGDHGPGTRTNYDSWESTCLYERYSILNAYYLPGVDKSSVPMDLSPVNSFRFIFNTYFDADLELLPNRQYFSTSAHLYEFTELTGRTQEACVSNSSNISGLSTVREDSDLNLRD